MPLNVRRIFASLFLTVFSFVCAYSQTATENSQTSAVAPPPTVSAPTAAEVMRDRIAKAKAYIVVKNYNAAIYELENIRRETKDPNIHAMLNVLLMHSYLEQTDYKRAQALLADLYKDLKSNKPDATTNYYAVAGQIVKGAKNQLERYRAIGLSVSDRNLPLEALFDIDKMRETLETVIDQAKTLGVDKKQTETALPILEEAITARTSLAKDDYDANRWKQEITDTRELMVNSRSTVISAIDSAPENAAQNTVATNIPTVNKTDPAVSNKSSESTPKLTPVANSDNLKPVPDTTAKTEIARKEETKKPEAALKKEETAINKNDPKQPNRERIAENTDESKDSNASKTNSAPDATQTETPGDTSPLAVGSLVEFATKRVNPVYPQTARTMRMSGVVRVEVTIDEAGNVAEIKQTDGPSMLQRAAVDAVRKWQFKPFTRDGQPTKATGFVNFNFTL